jgi:hypothetical protein
MNRRQRLLAPLLAAVAAALCWLPSAQAIVVSTDLVKVDTVTASGSVVDVPVYIRDSSFTPVGLDQPAGSKIQSFAIKVSYAPTAAISSITFTRAGITQSLTPVAEFTPSTPGTVSLVETFQESTNPIPFTLDAAGGDEVGHLSVVLSPAAVPGSTVTLTLDPTVTTVANQDGTTSETVSNGRIALLNGAINVPLNYVSTVPTMSTWALLLVALSFVVVALRAR